MTAPAAPAAGAAAGAAAGKPAMTAEQMRELTKRYQVIYPQYLDSSLTKPLGRRLTDKQSVERPTLQEMFSALKSMGFSEVFVDPIKSLPCAQSQAYCVPPSRGCIRVAIKEPAAAAQKRAGSADKRSSAVAAFPNKMAVMRGLAERIKAIPERKVQEQTQQQQQATASAEAMATYMAKSRRTKVKSGGGQKMKVVRR